MHCICKWAIPFVLHKIVGTNKPNNQPANQPTNHVIT